METYNIFYIYEDREGVMHTHCWEESIDYLLDHGCEIIAIRDVNTGKTYQWATNVRRIEDE